MGSSKALCLLLSCSGGREVVRLVAPMSSAKGLWSLEPVEEDLVLFARVCKLSLLNCVGARLTLAGCLKSVLEMSLAVFLINRASCPRMTLPSGQVVEVDLGVWICLRNAIWLPGSSSRFPWT